MADLVSVVIPVYNTNERFKACFESVLKQKYLNIEVILVDDGSCDTSALICDMVALSTSEFPVYVIHKPNGGVSRARNLGIDFANGKYLVFVDSDDQIKSDHISDFIEARNRFPEVGHIWCGFECSSDCTKYLYSEKESVSMVSRNDYFDLAGKVLTQSPWLRIYDVSILRQNHIRMIEDLSLTEDMLFNLQYMDTVSSTNICIINKTNYIYQDSNSDSLNHKFRKNLKEINDNLLDAILHYMAKWGLTDSYSNGEYYSTVYHKCVEVLNNTFHPNNTMSYSEKIRFNNTILRSERFVNALSKMSITIPNRLRKAYQSKNYFWVRVYERIVSIYSMLMTKKQIINARFINVLPNKR